jgi:NAD+ kinase
MKWGIVCKKTSKKACNLGQDVYQFLQEHGDVYAEKALANTMDIKGYSLKELDKKSDMIVTIGGDGTILMVLEEVNKPLFSINSGGMGFLCEVESKYAIGGLQRVVRGDYNIEERSKLKVLLDGKRLPDATNEVTVQTGRIAKIMYLKLFVEDELIETMGADGIIIATPTGSTSYALSVGGPIMDPAVDAMIIAPLAPFKLSARPWIVPLDKTVNIKMLAKSKETQLVLDGRHNTPVTPESDIQITGSENKARFVRFGETFYQMVRLKLIR